MRFIDINIKSVLNNNLIKIIANKMQARFILQATTRSIWGNKENIHQLVWHLLLSAKTSASHLHITRKTKHETPTS